MKLYRLLNIILIAVVLSSCTAVSSDPGDDGLHDEETWELQPYYGELRFRIMQDGTDEPIPGATLQVDQLRIAELKDAESASSDDQGQIVIHQLDRGITYWDDDPPSPSFTFAAPGYETRTFSVEDLAVGTNYDPYSDTDLPKTGFVSPSGEALELGLYEFLIHLMPAEIAEQEPIPNPTPSPTATTPPSTPTSDPTPSPTATTPPSTPTSESAARQIGRMLEVASIPEDLSPIQQLIIRDQTPFLRTKDAIYKLTEVGWAPYLAAFDGDFVGMDHEANVWISVDDGANIGRWDGQTWQIYGDEAGWTAIPPSYGWAVPAQWLVADSQNQMWLTTSNDVRSFDGQIWTVFSAEEMGLPLPDDPEGQWATFTLASSPQEDIIWVGQCYWIGPGPSGGSGVSIYDGQSWQPVLGESAKGCVNEITPGTNGDMWFNTDGTIWQYEAQPGLFHDFEAPVLEDWRYGWVIGLAVDGQGRPWPTFVTCGGASCYGEEDQYQLAADNTWVPMSLGDLGGPWPLLVDETGTTWYFRGGQVIEVTEDGLLSLAELNIKPQNVAQDDNDRVWFVGTLKDQPGVWMINQP